MAHECFSCGNECFCSGDIDDCIISITPSKCKSCGCEDKDDYVSYTPKIESNCTSCGKKEELQTVFLELEEHGDFCYDCCQEQGFCYSCGDFSSGTNSFEFSKMGAYCESCQEQIRDSCDYD